MMLPDKIRAIIQNDKLDLADKICEINKLLPNKEEPELVEILGNVCKVTRKGNTTIFDGSYGCEYTDNPRLENQDDVYYEGCGCTWGTDLDGKRYHKRYSPFKTRSDRYNHLSYGDIINEKVRIKNLITDILQEMGLI